MWAGRCLWNWQPKFAMPDMVTAGISKRRPIGSSCWRKWGELKLRGLKLSKAEGMQLLKVAGMQNIPAPGGGGPGRGGSEQTRKNRCRA